MIIVVPIFFSFSFATAFLLVVFFFGLLTSRLFFRRFGSFCFGCGSSFRSCLFFIECLFFGRCCFVSYLLRRSFFLFGFSLLRSPLSLSRTLLGFFLFRSFFCCFGCLYLGCFDCTSFRFGCLHCLADSISIFPSVSMVVFLSLASSLFIFLSICFCLLSLIGCV